VAGIPDRQQRIVTDPYARTYLPECGEALDGYLAQFRLVPQAASGSYNGWCLTCRVWWSVVQGTLDGERLPPVISASWSSQDHPGA
jgi:hypothetical protein